MKIFIKIFFVMTVFLTTISRVGEAGEKILYVPVDDRPINFNQTVEILKFAGYEMIVPPKNYFNRYGNSELPDTLWAWLEENISDVDAAVISSDAVLYGGLIPSRKHEMPEEILDERVNRFKSLHEKNPNVKIYILSSVMRTPYGGQEGSLEEPEYYAQYGLEIFRYSHLAHKEEVVGLTDYERDAMQSAKENIPAEVFNDWFSRRNKNVAATRKLIDLTADGTFSYLILGLDDHHDFSQTKKESHELISYAQKKNLPKTKFQALSGIDEFGLVLLTRAVENIRGEVPKIYAQYNKGIGSLTFPAYSDEVVSESVEDELEILGGGIVKNPQDADFVLLVNTDPSGETYHSHNSSPFTRDKNFDYNAPRDGTRYFVDMVENYINEGYPVAVADVTFGNGADNAMMNLLKERGLLFKLQAYAGWNTATNSIGYSLCTGILAKNMSQDDKDKILARRYLDDWAYQANVRTTVGDWIYYNMPDGAKFYSNFGGKNSEIEERITNLMRDFAARNLPPYDYLRDFTVTNPWDRMFEIDIEFKKQ